MALANLSLSGLAKEAPESTALWEGRDQQLRKLAQNGELAALMLQLKSWRSSYEEASCTDQIVWLKYAVSYSEGAERQEFLAELGQRKGCVLTKDAYYINTVLGADHYQKGRFDSAFYSFSTAFESARSLSDTNNMVLGLSNLAALYSELDWKVEALSTALRAYSISRSSNKISDRTKLFLNNNVAGLQLD